jgi:hypothetical protein
MKLANILSQPVDASREITEEALVSIQSGVLKLSFPEICYIDFSLYISLLDCRFENLTIRTKILAYITNS